MNIKYLLRAFVVIALTLLVTLLFLSFMDRGGANAARPASSAGADLQSAKWILTALTRAGEPFPMRPNHLAEDAMVLRFDPYGAVSGSDGCNSFGGSYEVLDDETLRFVGTMSITLVECAETYDLETALYNTLYLTSQYQVEGDVLRLSSPDGLNVLEFVAR